MLSYVHTMSVIHTASEAVWNIKNTKIIIIIINLTKSLFTAWLQ